MSQPIEPASVRHIAKLARLKLADDEIELFSRKLGDILAYVRQLDSVDVTGVEPMAHPHDAAGVLREDEPRPSFSTDSALRNAPQSHEGFFRVPKVVDSGA